MKPYWQQILESSVPQQAKGKVLDRFGLEWNLPRKKYLFIFKEFDFNYRKRLVKAMRGIE